MAGMSREALLKWAENMKVADRPELRDDEFESYLDAVADTQTRNEQEQRHFGIPLSHSDDEEPTLLMQEDTLGAIWDTPEEDAAWAHL